ncbi:MAG: PQQ-dependent sugar dehydrogenase [Acetobacteraceae bacterium]|nr:PQQ-dependent sugar dehydrogenase [Acetobacteraceae bacterium]
MTLPRRLALALPLAAPALARAQDLQRSTRGAFRARAWAEGLDRPWGGGFLPDGRLLVSERPGRLRLVTPDGRVSAPLAGVPAVEAAGQGGLLDIQPAPDFPRTREVLFVSSVVVQQGSEAGALTRLWRARLSADGTALEAVQPMLDCAPAQARGRLHFGGRLAFSPDGRFVFLTTGDRNETRERAQRLDDLAGKVIRLTRDGQVPADNPFVGRSGARPEIWSFGHRNPQGIAFQPGTGMLMLAEFGPRGGDELNLVEPGRNYGWPNVSYGREYWGGSIAGGRTSGPGITEPLRHWTPSVSPSGIAFAPQNAALPGWRGSLFLACLNPPGLVRLEMDGPRVTAEERLLEGKARFRQVIFAPDGALLILTDEARGAIWRVEAA